MRPKRISQIVLSAVIGIVSAIILNYFVLERILIPNPCYYHTHETTKLFDLFYSITSAEGYHPFPTKFNFILTLAGGAGLGLLFLRIFRKRKDRIGN